MSDGTPFISAHIPQVSASVDLSHSPLAPTELNLLGYRLHPMTGAEVVVEIDLAVSQSRRLVMANLNLHGMARMYDSPGMTRLLRQRDCLTMIDGMPVLGLANLLSRAHLQRDKRTTSLDFYDDLFALGVSKGWQFAYVGATADVLTRGLDVLRDRFPDLKIAGRHGYFDFPSLAPDSLYQENIAWLRDLSPDVVIVGMGMPRQEEWIEQVQHLVDARVFLPTGAYLDYQVGIQRPAPRWLGRYGLEGVYRLFRSPYRLGYRYLVEPFVLGYRIISGKPLPTRQGSPDVN
ncbi:MAG TPA: WecB/TagA/CpsF family glycosyltransferase [Sphingobium sp.]|uniref:WecB/TagA/CpsF family glycosyltransferase n=1 Tax=Sphingobium sp. TaxID=1912891 RepID=UPI002ED107E0